MPPDAVRQEYKDSWYTMIGLGILLGFSAIISYTLMDVKGRWYLHVIVKVHSVRNKGDN